MNILKGMKEISEHRGLVSQELKLIEEMAELTKAILKRRIEGQENVIEEMADVHVLLMQLVYLLDCGEEIEEIATQKVERELERINKEKKKEFYPTLTEKLINKLRSAWK